MVVRVSFGHSQSMCSRSVWFGGGVTDSSDGGVKYCATNAFSEKPGWPFCCWYSWTIVAGSAFGVESTKVF